MTVWRLSMSSFLRLSDFLSDSCFTFTVFRWGVRGPVGARETLRKRVRRSLYISGCALQNRNHHVQLPRGGTHLCSVHLLSSSLLLHVSVIPLFACLSDTSAIRCDEFSWASSKDWFVWCLHGHVAFSSISRSATVFMPVHLCIEPPVLREWKLYLTTWYL